ncbi:MAG: MotA/TolQ/ExbB proton channel family protein [Verrucomicrobiota bacterium]
MKPIVKWPLTAGIILFFGGPALGLLGMVEAFDTLETSGVGDMSSLSADISFALVAMVFGLPVSFVGVLLIVIAAATFFLTRDNGSSRKPPHEDK